MLQGLAAILCDLVLMATAPERPELTSVSPQVRDQLPPLAQRIGRQRLLQWQARLRGSEQQLRQSVQPRLWLEVLLLGLLAEAVATPAPLAAEPAPEAAEEQASAMAPDPTNLPELWQQILGSLELPSTRMLLSQQAQLVRLDAHRAVVQVAGNWMGMVQSRASLLEQAISRALGGSRQLVLEQHSGAAPTNPKPTVPAHPPRPAAPAPAPAPTRDVAEPDQPKPAQTQPTQQQPPDSRPPSSPMDEKVKRFADFFNGDVLDVDLESQT